MRSFLGPFINWDFSEVQLNIHPVSQRKFLETPLTISAMWGLTLLATTLLPKKEKIMSRLGTALWGQEGRKHFGPKSFLLGSTSLLRLSTLSWLIVNWNTFCQGDAKFINLGSSCRNMFLTAFLQMSYLFTVSAFIKVTCLLLLLLLGSMLKLVSLFILKSIKSKQVTISKHIFLPFVVRMNRFIHCT